MRPASIADPVRNVYSAGETSDRAKTNLHSVWKPHVEKCWGNTSGKMIKRDKSSSDG